MARAVSMILARPILRRCALADPVAGRSDRHDHRDRVDRLRARPTVSGIDAGVGADCSCCGHQLPMQTGVSVDDRVRAVQLRSEQRRRVDERLEGRARLAQRVRRAVELALAVILAADAWPARRRPGPSRPSRPARRRTGCRTAAAGSRSACSTLLLDARVEGRLHGRATRSLPSLPSRGELLDLLEGPVEVVVRRRVALAVDRRRRVAPRGLDLALGQEARLDHVVQHVVGAGAGRRQVDVRGVFGRRLEQARRASRLRRA